MPRNRLRRTARRRAPSADLDALQLDELVRLARARGINASTRWRRTTILRHLGESHGEGT